MEQQYLAVMMRSLIVAILLAALIGMFTQAQETTTSTIATPTTTTTPTTTAPATTADPNATATTAAGNGTYVTSNTNSTAKPTSASATTISSTSPPAPPGKLRPVGTDSCLQSYFDCTVNDPEFKNGNFCQAFKTNKACIKNCSDDDLRRTEYVDCQPNVFGDDGNTVSTLCQGRITECLSLSVKPDVINVNTTVFKTFFCTYKTKNETCFTSNYGSKANATCKADEFKEAMKIAGCTAAHTVISSALFICLAVFTQRLLYRC